MQSSAATSRQGMVELRSRILKRLGARQGADDVAVEWKPGDIEGALNASNGGGASPANPLAQVRLDAGRAWVVAVRKRSSQGLVTATRMREFASRL